MKIPRCAKKEFFNRIDPMADVEFFPKQSFSIVNIIANVQGKIKKPHRSEANLQAPFFIKKVKIYCDPLKM
jgi:hypothetical protein